MQVHFFSRPSSPFFLGLHGERMKPDSGRTEGAAVPAWGSREAFEKLFREHYAVLCAYASRYLPDVTAAEEAVQEVMFRLWVNREKIAIESSSRSYLFRAVRNEALNQLKHRQVRQQHLGAVLQAGEIHGRSAEEEMMTTELAEKIRAAIDRLPPGRKQVFLLSRYEGLSNAEIAARLGISVKTIENQMTAALRSLRLDLREYLPVLLWLLMR